MLDIYTILLLFLSGCLGGFFAGLLGIGGGIVFIPVLTYYFTKTGITDPDLTRAFLANSFFAIIFSGISASIRQYKMGHFYPKPVLYISIGAVITSLFVSRLISMGDWYNKESFTIFFISVLVFLNIRLYIQRKKETALNANSFTAGKFIFIGALTGAFAALSGLGGGFIMVMLCVQWLHIDIKQATAVSNGTIPLISIPLVVYYMIQQPVQFPPQLFHIGYIAVYSLLPVIAGVLLFSPLGVRTASLLQQKTIKMVFICFSIMIIIKMLLEIV
jgi:uncharacterized membrane protein YfcA